MDLGFSRAGYEIIAAYDNNEAAVETYNRNLGGASQLDLAICDFKKVASNLNMVEVQPDIIIGGPPCQGFTTAGSRFRNDPRNQLIRNYIDALAQFKPRWFVMENVEGIITTAAGEYLYEAIKQIASLNYSIFIKKVYMQEHSIPQRRKRVILVGNREGKDYQFPIPSSPASGQLYRSSAVTLRSAIEDIQDIVNDTIDQTPRIPTGIRLRRIQALKQGQTMKDLPADLQHDSFKRRAHRRVQDGIPSERRGGAPSGLKRLVYDEPCLTITSAAPGEFIHPTRDRTLTLRECARIQTFPDIYNFCGSRSERITQIGNAVPPAFAQQLADSILRADATGARVHPKGLISYELTKASGKSPALISTEKRLETLLPTRKHLLK